MADAFGQALLDEHRDERTDPLRQRDGDRVKTHPVGDFYFGTFDDQPAAEWLASRLSTPLVDLGAGAGRDALQFQERGETVALEVSEALVELLRARGVEQVRHGDMFTLRDLFPADRFRSALALGTQIGLAGSLVGLRAFLAALATVTTADATAVVDGYDPTHPGAADMLGFRADRAPGLASRVYYYEYGDLTGEVDRCRLFSPARLRAAAAAAGWHVTAVDWPTGGYYYRAALAKP